MANSAVLEHMRETIHLKSKIASVPLPSFPVAASLVRRVTMVSMLNATQHLKLYSQVEKQLRLALDRQEQIENEIFCLRRHLNGIAALCEVAQIDIHPSSVACFLIENVRIIDDVRAVLRNYKQKYITTSDIMLGMKSLGHITARPHRNLQATINMALRRMTNTGQVEQHVNQGRKAYRWVSVQERLLRYRHTKGFDRKKSHDQVEC